MSTLDSVAGVDSDPLSERPAGARPVYLEQRMVHRVVKRAFDLAALIVSLPLVLPLFALVSVLIKVDSRGPVFYRQTRVGLRRHPFRIWKFRKMRADLRSQGPMLTMRHDHRMTRVGRFLERTKLDELPQLINVLVGEMSVVGPRPEVPRFVEIYREQWDEVLSVKPGIFGASQNHFRNESELYPPRVADVEAFYVDHILPEMLELDARYAREATLLRDLSLLIGGVATSLAGAVTRRTVSGVAAHVGRLVALVGVAVLAMVGAYAARGVAVSGAALALAAAASAASLLVFRVARTHSASLTADDVRRLLYAAISTTAAVAGAAWAVDAADLDAAVQLLFGLMLLSGFFCFRILSYLLHLRLAYSGQLPRRLFWGALLLAPVSVVLVATSLHGAGGWRADGGAYVAMACSLLVLRPSLVLLARPPETRPHAAAWLRHEFLHVALPVAVGSALAVTTVDLAVDHRLPFLDVAVEAVTFAALLITFGLWQNRRLSQSAGAMRERIVPRLLIVGAGVELPAYLTALASSGDCSIAGVVTSDSRLGRSYISGHRIVGDVTELPEILAAFEIDQVVVLLEPLDQPARMSVEKAAAAAGVDIFGVRFLPERDDRAARRPAVPLALEGAG